jgi:hypothetical protein
MEGEDIPMPRLSPAMKLGLTEWNLITLGFPPRAIRLLLRRSNFPPFEFRTHQVCFLNEWTRETLNGTMHLSEISTLSDMTGRTVRRAFARGPEDPFPLEHYRALGADIELSIIIMLLDAFQRGEPMTYKELLKPAKEQYNSKFTKGWMHSRIGWHLDVLQECRSLPLEDSRLTVPRG